MLKVITAFELLILIVLLANCFRGRCDYIFDAETMFVNEDYVQCLTEDGELTGYTFYTDENIEETTVAYTDYFRLYPGAYRITLNYTAQVNYDEKESSANGNGYFDLESENNSVFFDFASIFLNNGTEKAEQTVQIRSLWSLDDMSLKVTYYGLGELTVYSAEVTEIPAYRYICLLGFLLCFLFFDIAVYLIFIDSSFCYDKELSVLIVICAAAVLPFLADYTFVGHDTGFHIGRIRMLAQELTDGNYFPAIYTSAANGYGYAAPLFYGQFFLYLPAVLYNCGFSLTFVYNFYLSVMSIAACLVMYYSSLKIIHKSNSALVAAAMYTFSGPRMVALFTRGALGDITAQVFFPLIVLGFYEIYSAPKGEKIPFKRYCPVIIGLTGVVVSHALSTVLCAMLIVIFCMVSFKKTIEFQRFLALAKAASLTIFINLAVLIPMLDSMRMNLVLTSGSGAYIQGHGAYLIQVLNSVMNNYDYSSEAGTASGDLSLSLGFATTVGLLLFIICEWKEKQSEASEKKNGFARICWCFSVLTLLLSSVYMFYDYLDFLPAPVFSVLTSYQFPWRWLSFASLFGVFCTAATLERAESVSVFGKTSVTLLLSIILVINIGQVYSDVLRYISFVRYSDADDMNIGGGGEYLLAGTDLTELNYRDLIYDETQLSAGEYLNEDGRWVLYDVENASDTTATVDIPLFNYDNYAAYDTETGEEIEISNGSNNRVRLNIPAGYFGTIEIKYEIPLLWKLAVAVSVVTDVLLIAYVSLRNRNAQMKKERYSEKDCHGILECTENKHGSESDCGR